ncbi:MAG: DsrE/DsrF/DrsH-like family protein [Fidelibacterota bacterium]|nr:MAG: DsrE/DsrF/DrsH-like family protein [Candidatus Neomarinimicrobiota bacterium]
MSEPVKKVSIIVSQGSLEGVYPGLIMANGARMDGIEANLFFTFFGLDAIIKKRIRKLKVATVGNPAMTLPGGLPFPTLLGMIPGMSAVATAMMKSEMEKLDIPPVDEFLEMIHDSGAGIYACKLAMDMFHYKEDDLLEQVDGILTVGQFYEASAGAQIIFT